jgi:hypothetical protein
MTESVSRVVSVLPVEISKTYHESLGMSVCVRMCEQ